VAVDDWVVDKRSVKVYINQATQASYVISIDALCRGNLEEPPRSSLYLRIMETVASLVPTGPGAAGTEAPNPPPQPPPAGLPPAPGTAGPVARL
jgi:hypothetical protein